VPGPPFALAFVGWVDYPPGVRVLLVLAVLVPLAGSGRAAGESQQQDIHPLTPTVEQRIETLTPTGEQRVQMVDAQGMQQITGNATDSGATRGAKVVGKVVLTVVGAAVSCGMMLATLLFL
jgi:hypothetical protein